MRHRHIQPLAASGDSRRQLEMELNAAQEQLREAEAELAAEQAAVNAFRMHCRLTLGHWVDTLLELHTAKQTAWTRLQLLRQEDEETGEQRDGGAEERNEDTAVSWGDLASPSHDAQATKRLYRELARRFHPDLSGDSGDRAYRTAIMAAINVAYQQQDVTILRELAGEPDPATAVKTAVIEPDQLRRLRQKIQRCRRRRRKASQQLHALRQETTARLWRRAQELENDANDWWRSVQRSLEREIGRLQVEVADLQAQVAILEQEKAAANGCQAP